MLLFKKPKGMRLALTVLIVVVALYCFHKISWKFRHRKHVALFIPSNASVMHCKMLMHNKQVPTNTLEYCTLAAVVDAKANGWLAIHFWSAWVRVEQLHVVAHDMTDA